MGRRSLARLSALRVRSAVAALAALALVAACGRSGEDDGAGRAELARSTPADPAATSVADTTPGVAAPAGAAAETANDGEPGAAPDRVDVTISGRTFSLELAADIPTRQRGLMYRHHIDPDGGMLFAFPRPDFQSFWMGWCHVDIDIIYLDAKGRVTAMHAMKAEAPQQPGETEEEYRARLTHYPSRLPAQFVIELAGGTLDDLDVAVGDTLAVDVETLSRLAQ